MAEAYIIDALRTPTGKRRGSLSQIHAADLGAHILRELVRRNAIPAEDYDDLIFGCVDAIGPLAGNIGRSCWLAAGLPMSVPGVTIDRQCGSSQQAVHFAAQAILSGTQDVIAVGGVQTMSQIPIGSAMIAGQNCRVRTARSFVGKKTPNGSSARIFHAHLAGSGDPAYKGGAFSAVGRVTSRGVLSAIQTQRETFGLGSHAGASRNKTAIRDRRDVPLFFRGVGCSSEVLAWG